MFLNHRGRHLTRFGIRDILARRFPCAIITPLLPEMKTERPTKTLQQEGGLMLSSGTMEIKLSRGTLRIAGSVDVPVLRTVLECLAG